METDGRQYQVGCEDGDGLLHVHAEDETCGVCQAHGDALAALDRILLRGDNAKCGDFQIVRKALTASGVPESVRELPAEWENGTEGMTDSAAAAYRCCARALRFALASAPAVLGRREIFYRLANYESDEPYEGGEDQPQFSYSRYVLDQWLVQDHRGDCTNEPFTCMRCFAERCWHKAGWIAAAPTDGRE